MPCSRMTSTELTVGGGPTQVPLTKGFLWHPLHSIIASILGPSLIACQGHAPLVFRQYMSDLCA